MTNIDLSNFGDQPGDWILAGAALIIVAPVIWYRSRMAVNYLRTKWHNYRGRGIINIHDSLPPDSPLR